MVWKQHGKYLIETNQFLSYGIQLSDNPYDQNRPLVIANNDSDWYVPFTVQKSFLEYKQGHPLSKNTMIVLTSYI